MTRDCDERFKTESWVSAVLTAAADARGVSKQELVHSICEQWARREVHAASLVQAAAQREGMPGIG